MIGLRKGLALAPRFYTGWCKKCEKDVELRLDYQKLSGIFGGWLMSCGHRVAIGEWEGERRWGGDGPRELAQKWIDILKERQREVAGLGVYAAVKDMPDGVWDLLLELVEIDKWEDPTRIGNGLEVLIEFVLAIGMDKVWWGSVAARGRVEMQLRLAELRLQSIWRVRSIVEDGKLNLMDSRVRKMLWEMGDD
jgi:hypothetical protein